MATLPTMTLAEIRAAVRNRADMTNNQFITDDELNEYVNNSLFELYDLLVTCYGEDYFVTSATATTVANTETVALPTDFFKLVGVDLLVSSPDEYVTLRPFPMSERNAGGTGLTRYVGGLRTNLRYRLRKNLLWLKPLPDAGQTIRFWYVPTLTPLVDPLTITVSGVQAGDQVFVDTYFAFTAVSGTPATDTEFGIGATDTLTAGAFAAAFSANTDMVAAGYTATSDGNVVYVSRTNTSVADSMSSSNDLRLLVEGGTAATGGYRTIPTEAQSESDGISGWLEFVVVDAAIKCKEKEESDVGVLIAQKNALIKRINNTAPNRDAGNPPRVSDVYRTGDYPGGYDGWDF